MDLRRGPRSRAILLRARVAASPFPTPKLPTRRSPCTAGRPRPPLLESGRRRPEWPPDTSRTSLQALDQRGRQLVAQTAEAAVRHQEHDVARPRLRADMLGDLGGAIQRSGRDLSALEIGDELGGREQILA